MKKKIILAAVLSIILAGCIPKPMGSSPSYSSKPYTPPPPPQPTPVCNNQKQCEAMWVEAQSAVQSYGGMKLQIATENRLETYNATAASRMGGTVIKYPVPDGSYEIRVSFTCYRYTSCDELGRSATDLFNMRVTQAGKPFETPAPPLVKVAEDSAAGQPKAPAAIKATKKK